MRSVLRSIRTFFTFGKRSADCAGSDNPASPTGPIDVTLRVPGMY